MRSPPSRGLGLVFTSKRLPDVNRLLGRFAHISVKFSRRPRRDPNVGETMNLLRRKPKEAAAPVDQRGEQRFSLVMRTAKLLCESGEYACVVRDISATGAKIRLFHDVPPDTHLYLELANGLRYAMERVWHEGDHAGFRFAAPIAVSEFIEESSPYPRRPLRLKMKRPALITADGRDVRVVLTDVSQQGACIEASSELSVKQYVRVEAAGMPVRFGHICWRRKFAHGLVFQHAFRFDELAQYAFAMQPFDEPVLQEEGEAQTRYA